MSAGPIHPRWLRWYPAWWRDRYGDELAALMEDHTGGRPPGPGLRISVATAGLRERLRGAGVVGDRVPPDARLRAGALMVLCAWALFMLAGASYQRASEHFAGVLPTPERTAPQIAFDVVATLGVAGVLVVLLGALVALPSLVRFLRDGGWPSVRRAVLVAAGLSASVAVAVVPLSRWAHRLNEFQRNGGDAAYTAVLLLFALGVAAALGAWTWAAVRCARRLDWPRRALRVEAALAVVLCWIMAAVTAGTAVWWGAMALHAPWFLGGTLGGGAASTVTPQMVLTLGLEVLSLTVAVAGVVRIATAHPLRPTR